MRPGTIEELSSGRFAARLPRALDPHRRRIGTYATYEEAESMLDGALAVAQKKKIKEPGGETLHTFLPGFLDRRELSGVRNIDRDRNAAKIHIETAPFFGTPLLKVTRVQVNDWLDLLQRQKSKKTGERLAPQTIRNILNLLRVCFEEATNRGLMMQNPARDLRLNRATTNTTEDAWTILQPAEQGSFLAAMPASERRYYQFAIGTGLRPGEQRALLKQDVHVDVDEPFLTVRYGSPGMPTKTGKPRRVPLFGAALEATRDQLAALKKAKNPKGLFWPEPNGRYREEGVPEGWASWLQTAGITRTVRPYDLRHTCASALVSGWLGGRRWTLEEVKEVLGHTDIKTTQRYAHLGETAIREAVRETQAALAGPKLVQNEQNQAQAAEIVQSGYAFVNRRSRVQISKSAPYNSCAASDPIVRGPSAEPPGAVAELFRKAFAFGRALWRLGYGVTVVVDAAGVRRAVDVLAVASMIARTTELAGACSMRLALMRPRGRRPVADRACRSLFAPSPGLSPPVCKGHDADFEQAAGYVDQRPPRKAASHASGASSFCVQRAIIDYRTVVESCRKLGRRIVVNAETIAALPESRGLLTGWFGLLAS